MNPLIGLVISTFISVLICTALLAVLSSDTQSIAIFFNFVLYASIFGWVSALVFGPAVYFIYRRINLTNVFAYIFGGLICCLPFWLVFIFSAFGNGANTAIWQVSFYCFSVGALSGAFFWVLIVRKSHSNKPFNNALRAGTPASPSPH